MVQPNDILGIRALDGYAVMLKARQNLFRNISKKIRSQTVMTALESLPRERFVPSESRHLAYQDIPLPIGDNQTISQPFIVAMKTEVLELHGNE